MPTYELSFTTTFYNESLNLPKQVSKLVVQKLKVLARDPHSAQGDAKKLKDYANVYRARVGDYRVFYSIGQGWVKLLSVRKRDERTYEDDLPAVEPPSSTPDSEALTPHAAPAMPFHLPAPDTVNTTPEMSVAGQPLPYALSEALLMQWHIPEAHWPALLAVSTEDALLDLAIPERYVSRVLDNLFPRPLTAISVQPDYVLPTPEDVERFAEEDLSTFLLKLTPEQELLVAQDRHGPTLVKGGPGTGKSTLAIYRVRRLLEQGVQPVLFTTYTNALVSYSEQLLTHLLGRPPAECGVKVSTVDGLAAHYYARGAGWPNFATEGQALDCLDTAMQEADIPAANVFDRQVRLQSLDRLGRAYLLQEFTAVIEAWGINTAGEYLTVERRGRRTPLKSSVREAVWAVYTCWRERMREQNIVLTEQIRRGALEAALALDNKPYQALIIDEAQDLSPVALRFLLALVDSPEHVYLTADASQSLYQRGFSWKQIHADLNVAGRTILLKRNYRNTAQIIAACASILAGNAVGDAESLAQEPSPHTGEPPLIQLVAHEADEAEAVRAFLSEAAHRYRLPIHTGAVLCGGQVTGKQLALRLTKLGISAVFQSGKAIDITARQVKVLTLHSAKGLEFPFVAIVGLDEGRLPRHDADLRPDEQAAARDEQRRLFYVGCSRAMRALLVCGSHAEPSTFLDPLTPPLWQRKDIA